jgi:prepilin-type N-terminal cleavage/methylation domain-containing protein/prepilin-type processing-associated H-X9-DG protein
MYQRARGGFTLIELLVVVGVISILAAILFPVFAQARDAGRRANCLSNLRQLALAHRMYVQDHDDTLPFWENYAPWGHVEWTEFLSPYYQDPRILSEGTVSPAERRGLEWLADYALCAWGPGGQGTREKPYWRWPGSPDRTPGNYRPMALAAVRRPAETVQFADGGTFRYRPYLSNSYIRRRHRNGLFNVVFLDGHARAVTDPLWDQVDQDERGYFYHIAAADR